ncbi:hypothetical protein [Cohnella yongneupensis]|uniref:Mercuric ion transport protein n=1 Tax=Cohnella yongneupensis TaxID=425006 RepID=A0ABW0QSD9_9BACL
MKNNGFLAGLGVIGLCALCCAIPLFASGAAVIGLSSIFLDPIWIAVISVVVIGVGVLFFRRKSKACTTCHTSGKCGCK